MNYNNSIPYRYRTYPNFRKPPVTNYNNRYGGFLLPFALGFVSSPLLFGATRPRPPYYPIYGPNYFPYY